MVRVCYVPEGGRFGVLTRDSGYVERADEILLQSSLIYCSTPGGLPNIAGDQGKRSCV